MAIKCVIWNGATLKGIHGAKEAVRLLIDRRGEKIASLILLEEGDKETADQYNPIDFVDAVYRKGSSADYIEDAVNWLMFQKRKIFRTEIAYIGDSIVDIQAAKKAGLNYFVTLTGELKAKDRPMLIEKFGVLSEQFVYSAQLVPARIWRLDETIRAAELANKTTA